MRPPLRSGARAAAPRIEAHATAPRSAAHAAAPRIATRATALRSGAQAAAPRIEADAIALRERNRMPRSRRSAERAQPRRRRASATRPRPARGREPVRADCGGARGAIAAGSELARISARRGRRRRYGGFDLDPGSFSSRSCAASSARTSRGLPREVRSASSRSIAASESAAPIGSDAPIRAIRRSASARVQASSSVILRTVRASTRSTASSAAPSRSRRDPPHLDARRSDDREQLRERGGRHRVQVVHEQHRMSRRGAPGSRSEPRSAPAASWTGARCASSARIRAAIWPGLDRRTTDEDRRETARRMPPERAEQQRLPVPAGPGDHDRDRRSRAAPPRPRGARARSRASRSSIPGWAARRSTTRSAPRARDRRLPRNLRRERCDSSHDPHARSVPAAGVLALLAALACWAHALSSTASHGPAQHQVRPGETLGSIAAGYGVSVDRLARANGLRDTDRIAPGRRLRLPDGARIVHRVRRGRDPGTDRGSLPRARFYNRLPQSPRPIRRDSKWASG